jgi:hypothetical protein
MTTAGSAGRPAVPFGPFVPPRFGRRSTPPATYLSLMVAILHQWAPARAITLTGVTSRRIHTAGAVLPTTLRIIRTLAAASAAAEKVLVNARRAVRRAVDNLTQLPGTSTTTAPPGGGQSRIQEPVPDHHHQQAHRSDHTRIERDKAPATGAGHRILVPATWSIRPPQPKNQESKINNSAGRK